RALPVPTGRYCGRRAFFRTRNGGCSRAAGAKILKPRRNAVSQLLPPPARSSKARPLGRRGIETTEFRASCFGGGRRSAAAAIGPSGNSKRLPPPRSANEANSVRPPSRHL